MKLKLATVKQHRLRVASLAVLVATALISVFIPMPAIADETRDEQWIVDALRLEDVHKLSQGEGVTVGVIDSGIDSEHPDLKGNIEAGTDFGTSKEKGLNDARGHGTGVSSLIVGHGHGEGKGAGVIGLAPKAKVVSVGLHWPKGSKGEVGGDIADAIDWLVDRKVDVISVSMSGYPEITDAVRNAQEKGVPVVASTGNTDQYADDPILGQVENNTTGWPASDSGAVPVSGTTENGKFWDGSVDLSGASTQPQFGISAPATDLITAAKGGGYETHSGTSGSAPIVAGTLALLKSAYPDLAYPVLMDRLLDTADDKGADGFDDKYGNGIVNPYRALTEETVYNDPRGKKTVSSPEDRLPLDEQGKDSSTGDGKDSHGNDGALTPTGSSSLLLSLGVITGIVVLAAAAATILIRARSKNKTQNFPPLN